VEEDAVKILLVQNTIYLPTLGGANKANRMLVEGLAGRGHSCRVVAPALAVRGSRTREQFLADLGERGIELSSSTSRADVFHHRGVEVHAVAEVSQLRSYLVEQVRLFNPTWIAVSSEDSFQVLLEAALEADSSRVVYLAHTTLNLPFGPGSFITSRAKTNLLHQTAGIITVSQYLKDYLQQWGGLSSALIPFPVYGEPPFPRCGSFTDGLITIINPSAIKGISLFLEMARQLPDLEFGAVPTWGTGEADRAAMQRLKNVKVMEAAENVDEIYRETRILVVPSLWAEAFGQVVVEAMLRGIPVVASDSGGLVEAKLGVDYVIPVRQIQRYEERLDEQLLPVPVVPEQEASGWISALRELSESRERYERVAEQSRNAAERFVRGLGIEPFERWLQDLTPGSSLASKGRPLDSHAEERKAVHAAHAGIGKLSPERRALLALRLKEKTKGVYARESIPRIERNGSSPPSFSQQRLWFLNQLEPGSAFYNIPAAVKLKGALNVEALGRALGEIVRRHEVLRTSFKVVDGQPVQAIAPSRPFHLPLIDLCLLAGAEQELKVPRLVSAEVQRSFDLAHDALLRVSLIRLGEEEHVMVLIMHHIAFDSRAISIFIGELELLYKALCQGRPASLPELPIQYADFAAWQRQWLRGDVLGKQLDYWKRQLDGAPAVLELPFDSPRPEVQSFRGASQYFALPPELSDSIKALSRSGGVTLFMTLLAAFKILLYCYTGQEDIVVGTDIANRTREETERLIGFFANQLVLRSDLSGNPSFRQLLERVRVMTLGAYAHQDLPFEQLVKELKPKREPGRSPLFQIKFMLENEPAAPLALEGLTLQHLPAEHRVAKFDLLLTLVNASDGLRGSLEYNTDILKPATIVRLLRDFQALLSSIVRQPDARLAIFKEELAEAEKQSRITLEQEFRLGRVRKLKNVKLKLIRQEQ
jgi:glycosyltransferase involved in cell wall biosynthesis